MLQTDRSDRPLDRIPIRRAICAGLALLSIVVVHWPRDVSCTADLGLYEGGARGGEEEGCGWGCAQGEGEGAVGADGDARGDGSPGYVVGCAGVELLVGVLGQVWEKVGMDGVEDARRRNAFVLEEESARHALSKRYPRSLFSMSRGFPKYLPLSLYSPYKNPYSSHPLIPAPDQQADWDSPGPRQQSASQSGPSPTPSSPWWYMCRGGILVLVMP